jgi:hypothetical protein
MTRYKCNLPQAIKLKNELYTNPDKRYQSNLYYIYYSSIEGEFFMQHKTTRSLQVLFDFDNLTNYNWRSC